MSDPQKNSSRSILMLTIVVAVVLMLLVVPFTVWNDSKSGKIDADEADVRIQPVARLEIEKAAPPSDGKPKDGATVFASVCSACHTAGIAGAPKVGDKAAWAPRIAQGKEALYKSALNGKNAMPARGGAASLADAEVKAAVDHLVALTK